MPDEDIYEKLAGKLDKAIVGVPRTDTLIQILEILFPGEEARVVKLEGHYDHIVLEPLAKEACERYNRTVVAVGGVHVDNASKEEIDILVKNCRELLKCI